MFVLLFKKKIVTNIDKEKRNDTQIKTKKKGGEYNQHRDIQRQK